MKNDAQTKAAIAALCESGWIDNVVRAMKMCQEIRARQARKPAPDELPQLKAA